MRTRNWRTLALDILQALLSLAITATVLLGDWSLRLGSLQVQSPGLRWSALLLAAVIAGRRIAAVGLDTSRERLRRTVMAHRWGLALTAMLGIAFALRFWGLRFGLPIMAHPDEPDAAGLAIFMLQRGGLDPDWFYYPTLYLYLLLPFFALHFIQLRGNGIVPSLDAVTQFEPGFYVVARSVSATIGALTILPLYRVATEWWVGQKGRRVGLMAATIVTFSFIHVRESHHAVTDALLTFMVTVSLIPIGRVLRRGNPIDYLLAGIAVGLAGASKYSALPMIAVIAAAHLMGRRPSQWFTTRPLVAGLGLGIGFLAGTPYAVLNWTRFIDHMGFLRTIGSNMQDPTARFFHLYGYTLESGFGPFIGAALWAAIAAALYRRRPTELLLAIQCIGFLALITNSEIRIMGRYLLPLLPATALLVSSYAVELLEALRRRTRVSERIVSLGLALTVIVAVFPTARESIQWDHMSAQPDSRAAAYNWAVETLPEGSLVYAEAWIRAVPRGVEFSRQEPVHRWRLAQLQRRGVDVVLYSDEWDRRLAGDEQESARRRSMRQRMVEIARFPGRESGLSGPGLSAYAILPAEPEAAGPPDAQ